MTAHPKYREQPSGNAQAGEGADSKQIQANLSRTLAETRKLGAETAKIQAETRYYPMVATGTIAAAAIGALAVIVAKVI